ncbi:hypothetical protein [Streptomyces kurssanovii]|uniref:Uncharacterized protein n=1 Tax=Streptomyces kurssanovii TaxID=67312 RepID=A0ABV3HXI0_9ACTN
MQGNTLLAVLTPTGVDQPWFLCDFAATPAWEEVRPVFEAWTAAVESHDPDGSATDQALQAVDDLGITLAPAGDEPTIEDFLLHVVGHQARYRH